LGDLPLKVGIDTYRGLFFFALLLSKVKAIDEIQDKKYFIMKLKNIIAIISFLMVAVSCSMEDDVLNEITKGETPNNGNQTEVYLSVNAVVDGVTTKASYTDEDIDTEKDLSNIIDCSVILFENDKVIGAYDNSAATAVEGGYKLNGARFLVKTGRNYEVYVIANTVQSFETCKTKIEVEETIKFDSTDLSEKVKFGKATVNISAANGSSSASEDYTTTTIDVVLSNLTAQVRLMDVLYSGFKEGTNPTTVILEKVELFNQNQAYNIAGSFANLMPATPWEGSFNVDEKTGTRIYNEDPTKAICSFQTFPNVNSTAAVALKLTFKVGSIYEDRTYIINRPTGVNDMENNAVDNNEDVNAYVNAGFIYQLYATVAVTGDTFNCTITCCTKDWVKNTYEVTMTDTTTM